MLEAGAQPAPQMDRLAGCGPDDGAVGNRTVRKARARSGQCLLEILDSVVLNPVPIEQFLERAAPGPVVSGGTSSPSAAREYSKPLVRVPASRGDRRAAGADSIARYRDRPGAHFRRHASDQPA